jgi:hypothetical protein
VNGIGLGFSALGFSGSAGGWIARANSPSLGKAEFPRGAEPLGVEGDVVRGEVGADFHEIFPDEGREEEAVVEFAGPTDEGRFEGIGGEAGEDGADEEGDGGGDGGGRVRLEGAEFDEAEAAVRREGIPEFVDADFGAVGVARAIHQEIAEEEVEEREVVRAAEVLGAGAGDLEFVEGFVGRLVDARGLRARAHVGAGEGEAERRVVLKITDRRREERGEGEERREQADGAAEDEVGAAAGADFAAVELEFARAESAGLGGFVELDELLVVVGPRVAGGHVDLEDAGVAREADGGELGIGGRRVAGEDDVTDFLGREDAFDGDEQREIGREEERRDEDRERAVADFGGEGAAEIFFFEFAEGQAEAGGAFAGEQRERAGAERGGPVVGDPLPVE